MAGNTFSTMQADGGLGRVYMFFYIPFTPNSELSCHNLRGTTSINGTRYMPRQHGIHPKKSDELEEEDEKDRQMVDERKKKKTKKKKKAFRKRKKTSPGLVDRIRGFFIYTG